MKRRMEKKRREREKEVLKTKKKQYEEDRVKGMVGGGLKKRKRERWILKRNIISPVELHFNPE